jgi:hypothetical protein
MLLKITQKIPVFSLFNFLLIFSILITACGDLSSTPTLPFPTPPEPTPYPESLVTFRVTLQEMLQPGDSLFLTELDEVTGLAINANQHLMEAEDTTTYSITLPFPVGSVVKYRYSRLGSFLSQEHQSDGRPVRYRLYHVTGPGETTDVITRWTDTNYTNPTGRIIGQVLDLETNDPIPDIIISAGGAQALTLSDGSYLLEGLPPGIHNLTAYAIDGTYQTFQQGARILAHSTTPADLILTRAPLVDVEFTVIVPRDTPAGAPVRLIGNLHQLGNTYADLSGGVSTLATLAPVLSPQEDGRYSMKLTIPSGADIRYKYSLGDGLWNAERTTDGRLRLRQLIVPSHDIHIQELINTWRSDTFAPITFEVAVPSNTPLNEWVSIQFNLGYGWLEAVPMWPLESPANEKLWRYTLYGPFNIVGSFQYRYCRASLCGSADDASTIGRNPVGRKVSTGLLPQTIFDEVNAWTWLPEEIAPATIPNIEVRSRGENFIAGIAFQANFHPSWTPRMIDAINNIKNSNANWLVLHPTWTFTRISPPVLEIDPSQDMFYSESVSTIMYARNQGLKIAIFPSPNFDQDIEDWWIDTQRDFSWWVAWFEAYEKFIFHHADIASQNGAEAVILGGEWILPALPDGDLGDGSKSNVPEDAPSRWSAILEGVRQRFKGAIIWAAPYPEGINKPPPFIGEVDGIYILLSASLASAPDAGFDSLRNEASKLIDDELLPFQQDTNKPIIIAAEYPSADGGITGCLPDQNGDCIHLSRLYPQNDDIQELKLDLTEQTDVYNALFAVINERDWIAGFVSEGYYPPLPLLDKSSSIHGKPASGTLWYWYPKMLGE